MTLTERSAEDLTSVSLVRPRLDAKPWGGTGLSRFGLEGSPGERIGEALVTANDAVVTSGFGVGQTLGNLIAASPARLLSANGLEKVGKRPLFPLLVKLIDATENLSIQVHPNDAEAAPFGSLGKTEAWHVLHASPGSKLYLGLKDPSAVDQFVEAADRLDGSSASHLRAIDAIAGETWLLPAGTVHALGAGVIVYEIQQPSAITYRLDDWGRVDAGGRPREMHREAGLAVLKADQQPKRIEPRSTQFGTTLVESPFFILERWDLASDDAIAIQDSIGPRVITVLSGTILIGGISAATGESVIVWPSPCSVEMHGDAATVLVGSLPGAHNG